MNSSGAGSTRELGDLGLKHLVGLKNLEELSLADTKIGTPASDTWKAWISFWVSGYRQLVAG